MANAKILEAEFESNICGALAAAGWAYSGQANDDGWDPALALFPADVVAWLSTQYPVEFEKAIPASLTGPARTAAEHKLCRRLADVLAAKVQIDPATKRERNGLLGVLRSGFDHAQSGRPMARFGPMVAFAPANPLLGAKTKAHQQSVLRVIRQVRFDTGTNQEIDLVLTVNGVPVITMELKTDNTQTLGAGIAQYRTDRKPTKSTPLLMPGRCLVHFVVSNQNVAMTTVLAGAETVFIPFDKGDHGHAGNAPSETGSPTDYLWREVLTPGRLLRILQSFAMREADSRLVFPRYHQLRAVEKITDDVRAQGAGGRYLVWHSAGSGKTKTIAWLAHRLSRLFADDGEKVFDSVLVISDRRVLDDQLRRAVNLLDAAKDYVVGVGEKSGAKSPVLRKALEEGGHIITVTLQSFPEVKKIIDADAKLSGRRWCVIADEAHSSQTGESALDLRRMLAATIEPDDDDKDGVTTDDLLLMQDTGVATATNMTFIALTATPKHRTLRLFGTKTDDGRWEAFDTYTMAQAIEEGFILDVLTRYSTYNMFARVRDTVKSGELVDHGAAISKLVRFIRLHPTAIAQKVEIVIEHFRANVAGSLGGTAKAMVVTDSRMAAVRWSLKMNEYLAKKGYTDMRALVAFSGKVTDKGQEHTEAGMNQVGDTARFFAEHDEAKVLIVADKFQTGFDEPRLCAMYVDKKLSGIAAIQTLSRLNRAHPDKPLPIVLDFVNEPADIQAAFKDYFTDAHITTETDPNALNILADRIDMAGFYDDTDLHAISEAYLTGKDGEAIQKALAGPVARWKAALRHAGTSKPARDLVLAFKGDLRAYANAWDFLSQVIDFQDADLHRRAIVARLLERNLHADPLIDVVDVSSVQLAGVAVALKDAENNYSIDMGNTDPLPAPEYSGERGGSGSEAEKAALDEAIDEVNAIFSAAGIQLGSGSSAAWTKAVWGHLTADDELKAMAAENTPEQLAASPKFKDLVTGAMVTVAADSTAMTEAATADAELSAGITEAIAKVAAVAYRKES